MSEEVVEEVNLFEDEKPEEKQAVKEEVALEKEAPSFDVPVKFQGKSFEDVVEAYTNLEKDHGRKANEVGELRKLTDEILKQQVTQGQQQVVTENINDDVGVDDFFDNPNAAVDKALANNPRLKNLEDRINQETRKVSHGELISRHADADEVVGSPEFIKWIQESPSRLKMLQESHQTYDVNMASDLINLYKQTKQITAQEAIVERDSIASDGLKKASLEKGNLGGDSKKQYRRSELIRLKIEQPSRYEAMSDEIRSAYAEGRVK